MKRPPRCRSVICVPHRCQRPAKHAGRHWWKGPEGHPVIRWSRPKRREAVDDPPEYRGLDQIVKEADTVVKALKRKEKKRAMR